MNGNGEVEQLAQQSTVPVSQFKCGTCQNDMMARLPTMRVFNFPEASGVVMSHERMSKCPSCGTVYVPLIKSVKQTGEIELVWKAVQTQETAVKPPSEEKKHEGKKTLTGREQ